MQKHKLAKHKHIKCNHYRAEYPDELTFTIYSDALIV